MELRLAEYKDAAAIAALSKAEIEYGLEWSWTPARVRRAIADPETNVLVAFVGRQLVGFGIMVYREETAHLCLFAVQPSWRRKGTGSAMLAWLEQVASVAGIQKLALEARHENAAALAFYRRHGYVKSAIVVGMYQGIENGVRLEKSLSKRGGHGGCDA